MYTTIKYIAAQLLVIFLWSITFHQYANGAELEYTTADTTESILVRFESDSDGIRTKPDRPSVPFGKKVVLVGTHDTQIRELVIRQIYHDRDDLLEVNTSGNNWYAIAGPYQPKQEVVLIFSIKSAVSESTKNNLHNNFNQSFNNFREDLFATEEIDSEDIAGTLRPILLRNLPVKFDNYTTPDGNTLRDLIVETLLSKNMRLLVELVNSQENLRAHLISLKNQTESFSQRIQNDNIKGRYDQSDKFAENVAERDNTILSSLQNINITTENELNMFNEYFSRFKEIIQKLELDENEIIIYQRLAERINSIFKDASELKSENNRLLDDLNRRTVQRIENTDLLAAVSINSSFGVKDIENFAGFDVGPTYIHSENSVSTMFLVNIYFGRVEVNSNPLSHRKLFSRNAPNFLKSRISLSTGIGITSPNIDKNSPLFFAGAGYRVNRLFRVTGGYTFYRDENEDNFAFNKSIGVSVNFRYINDILQIFNSASNL